MELQQQIDEFLAGVSYAVVGASADPKKYGNKVLRAYMQTNRPVFPINPGVESVEGVPAFDRLSDLPEPVHGISIITPPNVTEEVVAEALGLGIRHIWMQPGAESSAAIDQARTAGANVIAEGPCLLVVLRFRETEDQEKDRQ